MPNVCRSEALIGGTDRSASIDHSSIQTNCRTGKPLCTFGRDWPFCFRTAGLSGDFGDALGSAMEDQKRNTFSGEYTLEKEIPGNVWNWNLARKWKIREKEEEILK